MWIGDVAQCCTRNSSGDIAALPPFTIAEHIMGMPAVESRRWTAEDVGKLLLTCAPSRMHARFRSQMRLAFLVILSACSFTPRTAQEAAVQVSGLPVPEDARILKFVDQASGPVGQDLTLIVELELTESAFAAARAAAIEEGYFAVRRPMTDDSIPADYVDGKATAPQGFGPAARELRPGESGLFLWTGTPLDGSVVTLDPSRRRMIVRAWIG
ncbi:MAG: hypothetical protein V4617_01620 [Gemmatimonadota bacterium]